jgi:hypothetical protein
MSVGLSVILEKIRFGYTESAAQDIGGMLDRISKEVHSVFCRDVIMKSMDAQLSHRDTLNITPVQFQNYFSFFKYVREEAPPSLPALRTAVLEYLEQDDKGLAYINYPQLAKSETPEKVNRVLNDISRRNLGEYFADEGKVYGELKTPYHDPMTLGEFSLYRFRMGHGVVQDLMNISTLGRIQTALDLLMKVVPVSEDNVALSQPINEFAAFKKAWEIDSFISSMQSAFPK